VHHTGYVHVHPRWRLDKFWEWMCELPVEMKGRLFFHLSKIEQLWRIQQGDRQYSSDQRNQI